MNRHERRKLSRDARPEEIFGGRHGPIQTEIRDQMNAVAAALQQGFPGYDITLFVAEREADGRLPRFNYISTADRRDMLAVLKAFVLKNDAEAAALDKINDAPPTDIKQ